jgi:hypothetical protein
MDLTDMEWVDVNWINLARNKKKWCNIVELVTEGHIL